MENTQADSIVASMELMRDLENAESISAPLQKLFEECMTYISVSDLMI